jgi:23S rRNA 5-hydroxycytidine C2501 synthase
LLKGNKNLNPLKIELLSPAKNLECGIEAINHGADAVYIGAPKFSARGAANSTISDIEQLTKYAHKFGAKVHIALNTILTDEELEEANRMIPILYQVGVDALIIQDLGILSLDLPPIELHASTQMDNRILDKILLLEQLGFHRAVLARELSLQEIAAIRKQSTLALEGFVHGALCVSYSGQCYVSQAFTSRSANRGTCSQLCRLPYTLYDRDGNTLVENQHLLSLKDMDRSDYLAEMIQAGISSFKIEGRLKELSYVKNVTAFYRQKLDAILEKDSSLERLSFGKSTFFFQPDPTKTFHRDKTDYFLKERGAVVTSLSTPKSTGEKVGVVKKVCYDYFIYEGVPLNNGDGLIFFSPGGALEGFRVNKVEGQKVYPAEMPQINNNQELYRNFDHQFEKLLQKKSAERKIGLEFLFEEKEDGFGVQVTDEMGYTAKLSFPIEKVLAQKEEEAVTQIKTQFSKLGNTDFELASIQIQCDKAYFIPASQLSQMKREIILALEEQRSQNPIAHQTVKMEQRAHGIVFPSKGSYLLNIYNSSAEKIFFSMGGEITEPAFEKVEPQTDPLLMHCKHCIKYTLGYCPKYHGNQIGKQPELQEPLILIHKKIKLRLAFDCTECAMKIYRYSQKC